jgi:hypothetical protein
MYLILSFGKQLAQSWHIDMVFPNYQCSVILVEGVKGTHEYRVTKEITTVFDLFNDETGIDLWKKFVPNLRTRQLIQGNQYCAYLLRSFGCILADPQNIIQVDEQPNKGVIHKIGMTLTLPGSVIHAGPACSKAGRAIIFFSATPQDDPDMYDADTQHNRTSLTACIIASIWESLQEEYENKRGLLQLMAEQILLEDNTHGPDMIRHAPLRMFAEEVKLSYLKLKPKKNTVLIQNWLVLPWMTWSKVLSKETKNYSSRVEVHGKFIGIVIMIPNYF